MQGGGDFFSGELILHLGFRRASKEDVILMIILLMSHAGANREHRLETNDLCLAESRAGI